MLRIAIAGAGMVSRHHLIGWSRLSDCHVIAIADPDLARAHRRAAEFSIAASYSDCATMLDCEKPDALDIVSPVATHHDLISAAADGGIRAVLCQKPLAPDLAAARAAAATAADRIRLMVHENWRFRPHYRRLATSIRDGLIGTPKAFRLEVVGSGLQSPRASESPPSLVRQPCSRPNAQADRTGTPHSSP